MAKFSIPVTDHANKKATVSLPVPDAITDVNLTDMFGAVDGMTIGNMGQSSLDISTKKDAGPGGKPSNPDAQREYKWLCKFHDATTLAEHELEIPCADLSLLAAGTENMDLSAGNGQAFKTAFDANVVSPLTGNAVVLDSVESIGVNL